MGTWGPGLYANDLAKDLKSTIASVMRLPHEPADLVRLLEESFPVQSSQRSDEDYTSFWLVVADDFHKRGVNEPSLFQRAIEIVDSGMDLNCPERQEMSASDQRIRQFPRPGLYSFLEYCQSAFDSLYLYIAVRDELCRSILATLAEEETVPTWMKSIPLVAWNRELQDLGNIPNVDVHECLIVDDNLEYIVPNQRSQWIEIAKFESPYSPSDCELQRVQLLLADRLAKS